MTQFPRKTRSAQPRIAAVYNPYQAEAMLRIDGEDTHLRMTLGALAALEAALEADSLPALLERLSSERYRTNDLIFVINAGLYGAGQNPNIENRTIEGGALAALRATKLLLLSAFPNEEAALAL